MEPTPRNSSPAIPIAIICGFAMIALAIFFTNKTSGPAPSATVNQFTQDAAQETTNGSPRPVSEDDYIRGNPNAPILMIEYSDYDCPHCKRYHETMSQIMDEYGVTGRIAWVYRQFPIAQLHPNSPRISEAALCVGDIGGNDAFWKFTDLVFEERAANDPTNVTKLPKYAAQAGIDSEAYTTCIKEGRMQEPVTKSIEDAFNSGARGTPYTVLVVGNQQAVISGAQPYNTVKGVVENLIEQLDGTYDPTTAPTTELPRNDSGLPVLE